MEWQPEEQPLRQLAGYLRDSLNSYDRNLQKHAESMLIQATSNADFVNYLTFIFCTSQPPQAVSMDQNTYNVVRLSAALNLKTKIRVAYNSIPQNSLIFVRQAVLLGLRDSDGQIRNQGGSIITELLQRGGLLAWPEVLQELLALVGNGSGDITIHTQEAAMSALAKVCEDNRKILDKDYGGQRPLEVIIPRLLEFTGSRSSMIRSTALSTIQVFLSMKPQALISNFDTFMSNLFRLATDPTTDVRRTVCQAFGQLAEVAPDQLIPHLGDLVDYMIQQQNTNEDPELALDAAEFWLTAGEQPKLQQPLTQHLPKIIPLLLKSMIYDEDEVELLAAENEDAEEEDRAEDLKPRFAKAKGSRLEGSTDPNAKAEDEDREDGEISEEESEFEDDDPEDAWTLRKCSAAALDIFANVYHSPVFELILPYLKETLRHEQWPNREAAVLTLGAVADGCMDAVTPHLPGLIPYLISLLDDPQPIVRKITCWCLGRYSEWAAHLESQDQSVQFFEPMMEGILRRMLDNNKKVQEAAASAFASLEEKSDASLIPYCEPILRQFVECFKKYKDRNMYILYDCVQTLAECVMGELAKPQLVDLLMPALLDRYNKISDQSQELFSLLECLGYIAAAYGDVFTQFAQPIFHRCVKIVYDNIQQSINVGQNGYDEPDKDFLITSLDLMSAIIQAIPSDRSAELVATSQPKFFDLLCYCVNDSNNEVRQSSYALLGDCAIHIFSQLQPYIPNLMPLLIKQLDLDLIVDDTAFSVLNNSCWSLGEIALNENADLAPWLEKLYPALLTIISNEMVVDSVNENAAVALGRLGTGNSQLLAPHLQSFAQDFIKSMSKVEFSREKATAFLGFNRVIMHNPQAMESCLGEYFGTISSFPQRSLNQEEYRDLQQSFQQVLQGYQKLIPTFETFLSQLPTAVSQKLKTVYGL
ncbi:putative importin beta-2 subunit [Talaromyces proteolyticus]|uniref:Importin beta-2 subunit n=1 Tax=Talaromyces proteolyticus TaxID=1131652 RepID=A0AAD4KXN7_9EURO|nr:putative importin beta-2 subunit [Talaromyces proteolyticus]KAH8699067.1 putative importin beta-2 subunit [Talaromyces proteolyticus]